MSDFIELMSIVHLSFWEWFILIFVVVICVGIGGFMIYSLWTTDFTDKKLEQLKKYTNIKLGMSEEEMLLIMGGGYSQSLLKNNRKKYEWRKDANSYECLLLGTL